jgi:hypothetical protein
MTRFFVPGARPGVDPDRIYGEWRGRTERQTGLSIRSIRIYALNARRDGVDSETRVGDRDPGTGETVQAIFATSEGYIVVWEGGHIALRKRQIYEAIPFD